VGEVGKGGGGSDGGGGISDCGACEVGSGGCVRDNLLYVLVDELQAGNVIDECGDCKTWDCFTDCWNGGGANDNDNWLEDNDIAVG